MSKITLRVGQTIIDTVNNREIIVIDPIKETRKAIDGKEVMPVSMANICINNNTDRYKLPEVAAAEFEATHTPVVSEEQRQAIIEAERQKAREEMQAEIEAEKERIIAEMKAELEAERQKALTEIQQNGGGNPDPTPQAPTKKIPNLRDKKNVIFEFLQSEGVISKSHKVGDYERPQLIDMLKPIIEAEKAKA